MPLKRLAVGIAAAFLFSTLGLATSAQAIKRFSVVGGGAQSHIGNGLAIPIQQAAINSVTTGTMFPMTLRAPINGVPTRLTATATTAVRSCDLTFHHTFLDERSMRDEFPRASGRSPVDRSSRCLCVH